MIIMPWGHITSDLLWLESLLTKLLVPFLPPTLLYGNLSAVPLSHNPILHIELKIQFFHEHVIFNCMKIPHVPSSFQIADTITKPNGIVVFQELRTKLKVVVLTPP